MLLQQPVTPLHGGRQRPLPACRQPIPAGQQREPVPDPVQQARHAERLHPRRRQLDRQRHPVQPRHQPRHHRPILPVQREPRISPPGPVREQRHRLRPPAIRRVTGRGQGQRAQPVPGLPGHRQRLPAGRQHPHIITRRQQPGAQLRGRADHVLAVIQHQQQLLPGQHPRQRLGHRRPRLLPYPQRRGHHRRDLRRVPHRRQFRQPRPVREPARHLPGHLAGQPGLAHPARPGHRHQPALLHQPGHVAPRPGPADETRQRSREAMHLTSRGDCRSPHARTITAGRRRRTALPAPPVRAHGPASRCVKRGRVTPAPHLPRWAMLPVKDPQISQVPISKAAPCP